MERNLSISIIMVDGSFRERFHAIDFFSKQTFPSNDYEIIWVEYYDALHPKLKKKISERSNIKIITLRNQGQYHSSYCFNAAILESRGELLIIPDADIAVKNNFLEKVWEDHQKNNELVEYFYRYDELEQDHIQELDISHLNQVCILNNPTNYGGCLSVRKKWLLEINGYEQHYFFGSGAHANGLDVYTRFKNLGLHVKWHPDLRLYHPWHPGTADLSFAHILQQKIVNFRAKNLLTLPFQGIDAKKNSEIPLDLMRELEIETARHERKNNLLVRFYSKIGTYFGI